MNSPSSTLIELDIGHRRVWQFAVEARPKSDAAAHELRPGRYSHVRRDRFRQQAPELGMIPAEIVAGAVAVPADARAKALYFGDQSIAAQSVKIIVHPNLQGIAFREIQS